MIAAIKYITRSGTFWLAVVVAILLYMVWQSDKDRPKTVHDAQVQFCETVSQPASRDAAGRDADSVERDKDLVIFAQAAADARRAEGNIKTAEVYEGVVRRSKERKQAAEIRQANAEARAAVPCDKRFPQP